MNAEDFIENETLRNKVKNHSEVLDKVKAFAMIPGTDFISQEMVAQYYEVGIGDSIKIDRQVQCGKYHIDFVVNDYI